MRKGAAALVVELWDIHLNKPLFIVLNNLK